MKKLTIFILCFACLVSVGISSRNTTEAYAATVEQKTYCTIDEGAEFLDDTILVSLTNKVSISTKKYTAEDFPEISCIEVEDLTEPLWLKIINNPSESAIDSSKFHRMLKLTIANPSKANVIESIRKIEPRNDLLSAGPDYACTLASMGLESTEPKDPGYSEQWGLQKTYIPEAWNIQKGSSSVLVGVVDSGIERYHSDLINKVDVDRSKDFTGLNNPFDDAMNHGTRVAGIIGAEHDDGGIAGVCVDVTLVSLRVVRPDDAFIPIDRVANAIIHAIENGIYILNMSIAIYEDSPQLSDQIKSYPGLIICAAGNKGEKSDEYNFFPANYTFDNVVTVGASTNLDQKWEWSNYSEKLVDIFAPGVDILSTTIDYSVHEDSGTSYAAPFVTGVAALLKSYDPTLSASEIKSIILKNCDVIPTLQGRCVTGGRLNAYKALSNPHIHKFTYSNLETLYHTASCECGYVEKVEHSYENHTCTDCGYYTSAHVYNYAYEKIDTKQHYSYCSCGVKKASGHVVSSDAFSGGKLFAICLLCGGKAEAGFTTFPESILLTTPNGSFILPNGVIVLVDEDWEAYLNGTLTFTPGNYSYT